MLKEQLEPKGKLRKHGTKGELRQELERYVACRGKKCVCVTEAVGVTQEEEGEAGGREEVNTTGTGGWGRERGRLVLLREVTEKQRLSPTSPVIHHVKRLDQLRTFRLKGIME